MMLVLNLPLLLHLTILHASDIRRAMGETTSYHERINSFLFFLSLLVPTSYASFGLLWFSLFVSPMMVLAINILLDFCVKCN